MRGGWQGRLAKLLRALVSVAVEFGLVQSKSKDNGKPSKSFHRGSEDQTYVLNGPCGCSVDNGVKEAGRTVGASLMGVFL